MLAAALPGPLLVRWRAGTLKPAQTRQALNRLTQRATQSLQRGGQQLLGQLTPAGQLPGPQDRQAIDAWAVSMTGQQRALYQAALRLVIGDREPTAQEARLLRQYLDRQFGYLRSFQRALTTGRQARNGTLAARMGLYGQTVRGFASQVQRLHATLQGMRYEINRMGAVEHHCSECPEITALGWQPIGSLKPIGERECLVNCKCYLEYAREKPAGKAIKAAPSPVARVRKVELAGFDSKGLNKQDARKILGFDAGPQEYANLVGAQDGAKLSVTTVRGVGESWVRVEVEHPEYRAVRMFSRDHRGILVDNHEFFAKRTGTGLGTKVFSEQVEYLAKLDVHRIDTEAVRIDHANPPWIGYKVWPKLGYDAELPQVYRDDLPASLAGAGRVSDLMKSQEGRDWWAENGHSMPMRFDMRPGSLSRRVLDAYLKAKRASRATGST